MYLLNNEQIRAAIQRDDIGMWCFSEDMLEHSYYYFRLDSEIEKEDKTGVWQRKQLAQDEPLSVLPDQCVRVQSYESFSLSARIFALLGSKTELARRGVDLQHGLTMDPLYPSAGVLATGETAPTYARLEMALVNHSTTTQDVRWGSDALGKICFFNIGDTYPVLPSPRAAKQYKERIDPVN